MVVSQPNRQGFGEIKEANRICESDLLALIFNSLSLNRIGAGPRSLARDKLFISLAEFVHECAFAMSSASNCQQVDCSVLCLYHFFTCFFNLRYLFTNFPLV